MKKKNIFKKLDNVIYEFFKGDEQLRREEMFREWRFLIELKRRGWSVDRGLFELEQLLRNKIDVEI